MDANPYAPGYEDLPDILPVFPIAGVLLLPGGRLPLNVFEPRYKKMVEDAFARHRMIGIVQPRESHGSKPALFEIGCAGRITQFEETREGHYLITLIGLCRFRIENEQRAMTPYRQIKPLWPDFRGDLESPNCLDIDREKLLALLSAYFSAHEMTCDWQAIEGAPDARLITCLSMVCPFDMQEKQALLEAPCYQTRAEMFVTMLEMAVKGGCKGPGH